MSARHFVTDLDLNHEQQARLLSLAAAVKADPSAYRSALSGKVLAMLFMKRSTRTRVSFESGMIQLGGQAVFLSSADIQVGRGEPIADTGQVLSRYLDIIMIRTFAHDDVRQLADASRVPVINGLDDRYHPCQVLADLQTVREAFGSPEGRRLAYVGDGNNMAHSLMLGGALAGMSVTIVAPAGYHPDEGIVTQAQEIARPRGSNIVVTDDLGAVDGADAVYTDVWASMGQEEEAAARKKIFAPYQVTSDVMAKAKKDAIFLHCLPAHRGEEVAADVIDGPQSRVFDQAENRLHAQKALMLALLEYSPSVWA